MKDKMTPAEYEEALIGFRWEYGVDNFDEAMMDLFDRYHPEAPPDRFVCMSYDSIAFSLKVRDDLRLTGPTTDINEMINRRLLNYRKSGKLEKRRERQSNEDERDDDLPGQMKMPWQPDRPTWDKNK